MVTTNSKFLKEIKTLIASTNKALTIAKSEIDKVDAKYKALAEQEKKGLANTVKMLEAQLEAYSKLTVEETTETIEEKEETVVDTIYPENTEETVKATDTTELTDKDLPEDFSVETTETTEEDTAEDVFDDDTVSEAEELADAEAEANVEAAAETTSTEDEWPEFPTEWK